MKINTYSFYDTFKENRIYRKAANLLHAKVIFNSVMKKDHPNDNVYVNKDMIRKED